MSKAKPKEALSVFPADGEDELREQISQLVGLSKLTSRQRAIAVQQVADELWNAALDDEGDGFETIDMEEAA